MFPKMNYLIFEVKIYSWTKGFCFELHVQSTKYKVQSTKYKVQSKFYKFNANVKICENLFLFIYLNINNYIHSTK